MSSTSLPSDANESGGSKCEIISLESRYNQKGRREIRPSTSPLGADERKTSEWAEYALILTRIYNQEGIETKSQIEIRSPHILKALKSVTSFYPGAPLITDIKVLYEKPYRFLLHYFEDLQEYSDKSDDDIVKMHLGLLIRVIRLEMGETLEQLAEVLPIKKITFLLAWLIFRPGTMVFTEKNEALEKYRVHSVGYETGVSGTILKITGEQIDYDGKEFRTRQRSLAIPDFAGAVGITSLPVYPVEFHPEKETAINYLVERGHKWFKIHQARPKTMTWTGICSCVARVCGTRKFAVSGRIVIDNDTFNLINPNLLPSMGESIHNRIILDGSGHKSNSEGDTTGTAPMQVHTHGRLTDNDAALCTAFVSGYSLNKRLWGYFDVSLAKEVEWSTNAFEKLILRTESKEAIRALVKSYIDTPTASVIPDLVQGKGLGMVFLLHGPPGVGKTLTAETIAEHLKRPLYVVSGGELGTNPDSVEKALSTVLEVATVWKAVVLIDEADVFLQKRDLENLERNSLVAIFLRQLEYYEGLMFLTTNRVSCIDDAFQSRIDVSLNYPDLTEAMRRQLWESSLRSLDPSTLDIDLEKALPQLEKEEMNGREIRKTIKAAKLMASYYNEKLTLDRLYVLMGFRMVDSLPAAVEDFGGKPGSSKRQRLQ